MHRNASFKFKRGSILAKLDSKPSLCATSKEEIAVLRNIFTEIQGEHDSFALRYRALEMAAASPICTLKWWPPADDMMAIIERAYRANLGLNSQKLLSVSATSENKSTSLSHSRETKVSISSLLVETSMPTSELEKESRQNEIMYGPGFTLNLLAEMYRDLVEHQKEQTQHFDSAISRLLEEKRLADEKQEQLRKEAEQARQDEERKKMDALEATVRIGGKAGAMAKFEIQKLKQAALTEPEENGKAKANDAAGVAYRQYEKAWPGGTLTVPKLESVFKDLPSRPSGSQARYFFENRSRYCDESRGQDYLTTDGFAKLVQDLGFLQKKMAEEKQEALKKIFNMLDAKRKGEISLLDILKQIDSQDKELLMPMVDVLMHQCDVNKNGLLDLAEFHAFYTSWVEMHRIFEIFDDCRLEETWSDDREGHLEFADVELLSSVFLSIRSKTLQGRHQVAPLEAVITSLDLTTHNPSTDEIETAIASVEARSDVFDFLEFLEVHKKLRWLRTNTSDLGNSYSTQVTRTKSTVARTKSLETASTSRKSIQRVPQTSTIERVGSASSSKSTTEGPSLAGAKDKLMNAVLAVSRSLRTPKATKAPKLPDQEQEEKKRVELFERRKQMSSKQSSRIMQAILKMPIGATQVLKFACPSDKFRPEDIPASQERSAQDVCELMKLFRKSSNLTNVPSDTMMALAQLCTAQFFPSRSSICDFREWGRRFFIVIVGLAEVYVTAEGHKVKVAELRAGQCFGEMFLLFEEHLPRRFKIEASTDGVLVAFIEKKDYHAMGLDACHRSSTWESLSKKHSLLLQMQILSHLEPTEKFHLCHQLRERTVMGKTELYNSDTDALDVLKADQLFRDSSVLQERVGHLFIIQAGNCDVWIDAPPAEKKKSENANTHERDLSAHALFQMHPQMRLNRVSNLAAGAIFGSFATGPKVRKITASNSNLVTVYMLRPEEAMHRLRREGIQKIFNSRDSREQFILNQVESTKDSKKEVNGFLKGERNLKDLGTMLGNPPQKRRPEQSEAQKAASVEKSLSIGELSLHRSQSSSGEVFSQDSADTIKPQFVSSSPVSKMSVTGANAGGQKQDRCHIPNLCSFNKKDLDLIQILGEVKKSMSKEKEATRPPPPTVPDFTKTPQWLDDMRYRFAVHLDDPLRGRETEAQQKLVEAFVIYEDWQNMGRDVDFKRYLDLMKASHLVGNKSDPRDNLLTSLSVRNVIEVFKQVKDAGEPCPSLLKGRNSMKPAFLLTRFSFSQCLNLIAQRLCVEMPRIHNFPIDKATDVPASKKSTRLSLTGVEADLAAVRAERQGNSMQTALQEQIDLCKSGRPGSTSYFQKSGLRPATSCGFIRATGLRENTADSMGRSFPKPEDRPRGTASKVMPLRPGSVCVVSMMATGKKSCSRAQSTDDALQPYTQASVDQIYGSPRGGEGERLLHDHIEHQRNKRTRSIKRTLKRLRLPVGMQIPPESPAEKVYAFQKLQEQLYGSELQQVAQLHWVSNSGVDQQLQETPVMLAHEHLHSTPVHLTALTSPSLIASQSSSSLRRDAALLIRPATSLDRRSYGKQELLSPWQGSSRPPTSAVPGRPPTSSS